MGPIHEKGFLSFLVWIYLCNLTLICKMLRCFKIQQERRNIMEYEIFFVGRQISLLSISVTSRKELDKQQLLSKKQTFFFSLMPSDIASKKIFLQKNKRYQQTIYRVGDVQIQNEAKVNFRLFKNTRLHKDKDVFYLILKEIPSKSTIRGQTCNL